MRLSASEQELRSLLLNLGESLPTGERKLTKEEIREFHEAQRLARLAGLDGSCADMLSALRGNLASPDEISVEEISPRLIPVHAESLESKVFAAATLTWSIPVSQGFGRRMRFLVRDQSNGKLIGIMGLADPVFNLRPRDAWVGWSAEQRKERLVHVMDAFVLGALPPYNRLLGGKLVALLAASTEVVRHFRRKYGGSEGIISEKRKNPRLVLLTTTSALGRSSIYNRLRIPGSVEYLTDVELERVPTWFTQGYGHFHVDGDLFSRLQGVLERRGHPYAKGNRFGDGPNWKVRVIRQAIRELGLSSELLRHGIQRQVFVVPLAENTRAFLLGRSKTPRYITLRVSEIAEFWRRRWGLPRSQRCPSWRNWSHDELLRGIEQLRARSSQ